MRPSLIPLLALAAGCATAPAPAAGDARLAIVETSPGRGQMIAADTHLRLVAEYSIPDIQPGRDRITVVLETTGGRTWEPTRYVLSKAQGRVTFELLGADLLKERSVVRPLRLSLMLGRFESPQQIRRLTTSEVISFPAEGLADARGAKFLPPSIGRDQILVDTAHDPRYRPRLPPDLSVTGMVVWGLFKLCVDERGAVYDVTVLKSADRLVDDDWVALMRTWPHKPYLINGAAVPYCYPLRLEIRVGG